MPKCNLQAFLREISISIFGPFCSWVVFIFAIELHELSVCFRDESFVGIFLCKSFFLFWRLCLLFRVSFGIQMVLWLKRAHFLICGLFFIILRGRSTANSAAFYVKSCPVYVFLKNFIVSIITFRYIILFGVYFVYGVRKFSNFILIFMSEGTLTVAVTIYIPNISRGGFPCLHTLSSTYCF